MGDYEEINISGTFYTLSSFYFFYFPIKLPFQTLEDKIEINKIETFEKGFNGILEKPRGFGFGWVGVQIKDDYQISKRIKKVEDDFYYFEHTGTRSSIGETYKKIIQTNTTANNFYNLYLTDPNNTKGDEMRIWVLFKLGE